MKKNVGDTIQGSKIEHVEAQPHRRKVQFCGVIQGSVTLRCGETEEQAIERAQEDILALMEKRAKRLSDDGMGPNVSLEINDNAD